MRSYRKRPLIVVVVLLTSLLSCASGSIPSSRRRRLPQERYRPYRGNNYPDYDSNTYQQRQREKYDERHEDRRPDLSDVWLCMFMALGWTVWMLSSFIRSDLVKYQKDSVLVRGHVLQVSVQSDQSGIPIYHAVIDYMLNINQKNVQIRKEFETQQSLEQGFANVELLVLPEEPTHSVLKDDWEKEMEEQREESTCFWETRLYKRLSIAFAGILVLASVAGGILAVNRLDPMLRRWGWMSVCIGVALLLPTALLIHRALTCFQKSLASSEGIIIQGAEQVMKMGPFQNCEDYDILDARACDEEEALSVIPQSPRHVQNEVTVDETAGCYFIQLPPAQKLKCRDNSRDNSSISSISMGRTASLLQTNSTMTSEASTEKNIEEPKYASLMDNVSAIAPKVNGSASAEQGTTDKS